MKAKRVFGLFFAVVAAVIVLLGITFFLLTSPLVKIGGWPTLDETKLSGIRNTVTVTDADGAPFAERLYSQNRIYTPLSALSKDTVNAFLSVEDKRFYKHHGVDYIRMLGAAKNNLLSFSFKEGASTITQQLIKNTHLSNEKTIVRKLQEIRIAKALEKRYTKEEILESYLNVVCFGGNIYGIGKAARVYFDKDAADLTVSEGALLAGIINNPTKYNPLQHVDAAKKRRDIVLGQMEKNGKLTKAAAAEAKALPVQAKYTPDPYAAYLENVLSEAAEVLDCLPEEVFEKQATIVTNAKITDFDAIFNTMRDTVLVLEENMRVFVADNVRGEVLFDTCNGNFAKIKRQPGSAIKPFLDYAPALEKKLVYPASVLIDEPTDFGGYTPKNFGDKYYGAVTVKDSLKDSLNIPALKLLDMSGLSYAKSVAAKFGLPLCEQDAGYAAGLGGLTDGVTLKQLADAYSTLAGNGRYEKSRYIDAIFVGGKQLYKQRAQSTRAVGSDTAYLLTDMLRTCAQTGTAKKLSDFPYVAAKTGTVGQGKTNSDAYCIAYTPTHTVAVWLGSDEGKQNLLGGGKPTQIARDILRTLPMKNEFAVPNTVCMLDVDGKKLYDERKVYLAAPTLPKRYRTPYWFSYGHLPREYSYGEQPYWMDGTYFSHFEDFEFLECAI